MIGQFVVALVFPFAAAGLVVGVCLVVEWLCSLFRSPVAEQPQGPCTSHHSNESPSRLRVGEGDGIGHATVNSFKKAEDHA